MAEQTEIEEQNRKRMQGKLEEGLERNPQSWTYGSEIIAGTFLINHAGDLINLYSMGVAAAGTLLLLDGVRRIENMKHYYKNILQEVKYWSKK